MKLFKKLDDYLLHYYPSIWITRVHYFLPIGLAIFALLFFGNLAIGWSPKDDFPQSYIAVVLMIIPILIYLVYWFVFQSRYNVAKSGGRMPLGFEYLNFFLYMLVFFVAFLIISAIPLSNLHKVKMSVDKEELMRDIVHLNKGNVLVNSANTITFTEYGTIQYVDVNYVYGYYNYDDEYYSEPYYPTETISITRNEALIIIDDYIKAYNKYASIEIYESAQEILREREENIYTNYYYSDENWQTQSKISELDERIHTDDWYEEFQDEWFWKVICGLMAFFSMIVWLFKQMKLRHFVIGFISICLTPLFAAIVAVIIFEVIGYRGSEEKIVSFVCLLAFAILIFFSIRGYMSHTLNNTGYVMTMYLQFFLPLLPMFLWFYFIFDRNFSYWYWTNGDDVINILYWCGWIVGLISILLFKPLYTKFGNLPARN